MKDLKMKTPFSINLIYWMVNSLFWMLLLGLVTVIVDQMLYWFSLTENAHFGFTMALPRDLLPISEVDINGNMIAVQRISITGRFNSRDLGLPFEVLRNTERLVYGVLIIYALRVIIKMLKNVKQDIVFVFENVNYFKKASYAFYIIWIIRDIILQSYVQIQFTYFDPFNNLFMDYLWSTYLLIASILLAIAFIFEQGVKLQNYKDLTI